MRGARQGIPTTSVGVRGEMGVRGSETGGPHHLCGG